MAMLAVVAFIGNANAVTTNRVYSTNKTVGGVEMTPIQQLVYAVTNASDYDVVLIEPGTYTFTGAEYGNASGTTTNLLYSTKSGVTIIGDTDTSRKDWTLGSEPVVIDLNGKGRLFRFTSENCSVRNIAIMSSASPTCDYYVGLGASKSSYVVITNCTIRGISPSASSNNSVLWFKFYDCLYTGMRDTCRLDVGAFNCDFVENATAFNNVNAYGCTFRGNASCNTLVQNTGSEYELVGCKFISNANLRDIVLSSNCDLTVKDCEFSGNAAPLCCNFSNSSGNSNDVVVSGCKFTGNKSILRPFNSDNANPLVGTMTVTNCLFIGNTAGSKAATGEMPVTTVDVLVRGIVGDKNRCMIYDSVFSNNQASAAMGLCNVLGVHAVRCTFTGDGNKPNASYTVGNWRWYNEAADNSILEECDVSNGELRDCVVDRCRIHDVTSNVYAVFKDSAYVTNTLVECCGNSSAAICIYASIYKLDAELVNCTIVSNNCITFNLAASWDSSTIYSGRVVDDCRFVNCLFNSNRADNISMVSDFTIVSDGNGYNYTCFTGNVYFANSAYGLFNARYPLSDAVFATKTNGVDTLTLCANPKFADEPKWSLSLRSPLVGKGDASIWTDEDIDLAGKLRLRDGKADIGCYQCWLNPAGFMLIVR